MKIEENSYRPSRPMENYGSLSPQASPEEPLLATRPCPTCRGVGRIGRDQENSLVALIPVRDKRLKPRRTCLYVILAVLLCLTIGGLLMFFLLPRSVMLSSDSGVIKPLSVTINVQARDMFVRLGLRNEYNITNENFFPVTVTNMEVRVLFDGKVMQDASNDTAITVAMRSTALYSLDFNVTFTESLGYIALFCNTSSANGHILWMPFQATATTSYYGHSEETTLNVVRPVKCSSSTFL